MTRRPDQLPPDVEHDVAERLSRALRGGPADVVDVTALAAGTRRGIGRAATRRRTTVLAAAVAAVAVPFGVAVLGPSGSTRVAGPATTTSPVATSSPAPSPTVEPTDATTSPTQSPTDSPTAAATSTGPATSEPADPTSSAPAPDATPVPRGTVVPLAALPSDDDPNHVAYRVPDEVRLVAGSDDFPRPMIELLDLGDYRWEPTVSGQACGGGTDPMPVAARQWGWAEENSNRDQLSVWLVVSGWKPGTTPARFADVVQNDGPCRFSGTVTEVSTAGLPGDDAWAATVVENGYGTGHAVIRVGDVIVGVQVEDPAGKGAAVSLAKRLAARVADRVGTSGLAATAATGG